MPKQDLNGKVALITGANSGIGRAIAERLSTNGVKVALAARTADNLGIEDSLSRSVDVRDLTDVEAFAHETAERFGRIDILVANAGVGHMGEFLGVPAQRVQEMIETNFAGTVNAVRAALPHLLKNDTGDILAVASEAGRRGLPYEAAYSASKFGQVGFIKAMDHELRSKGIRATNLCPGGVATNFAVGEGRGREEGSPVLDAMMQAEDIADLAEFVLTRPARYRILEVALRSMSESSWG
ncbi:SDR family oxidoreductase [Specibacter cremeus]|uniref:SDR family oxidoreductase n=1 Tax=Specibacter cremeus TaxID=1629051 RepID=UPI000F773B04|nr:SDR family oxidoreductase [Specibacter cremeus]